MVLSRNQRVILCWVGVWTHGPNGIPSSTITANAWTTIPTMPLYRSSTRTVVDRSDTCLSMTRKQQPPPSSSSSSQRSNPSRPVTTTKPTTTTTRTTASYSNADQSPSPPPIRTDGEESDGVIPTVTNDNNTTNNNKASSSSQHFQTQQALQTIRKRHRSGQPLTQSYCDSVLGLCVAHDEWESVLDVLELMKHHQLGQTRSTYRACLQACLQAGNGAAAKDIFQAMETALIRPEPYDVGLCVTAMCRQDQWDTKQDWWRKALVLLKTWSTNFYNTNNNNNNDTNSNNDNITSQTTIPLQAYHVILERMVDSKQWKEAVRLLRIMEDATPIIAMGETATTSTATSTTTTTTSTMVGNHPSPDVITYREVIECCVSANQAEQAVQVLYSMKDRGVTPTSYACELVIGGLAKKLLWRRGLQVLELMTELNIPKTVITYNTIISACARAQEVGMAKSLLARMQKEGIRPDEVSFNSVIGACASTARWKDALSLLDQCYREPGVTPNIYIYTNAMRACAKGGNTKRALSLLQVVKDKGLPLDTYCYTAVIDACAKAKLWRKALSLLEEMQQEGIEPSEVTYSVTISACGNGGQWRRALDLLDLMKSKGMSVNVITYNAVLTALSKASRQHARHISKVSTDDTTSVRMGFRKSQVTKVADDDTDDDDDDMDMSMPLDGLSPKALAILADMRSEGIEPDGFCYSSAISCCGAEGRWKEALDLMETMKRGGPRTRPNRIAYTAAISACGKAGKADQALELFQAMKNEGLSADRVAYNTLFSALRVAGDADRTFELWGEICGTRSTVIKTAIATAKDFASPDIITLTDCIATLSRAGRLDELDQVFQEGVSRGIILRNNTLDLQWETDLSGMSLPVARAAIRYILHQIPQKKTDPTHLRDMTFITGIGMAQQRRRDDAMSSTKGARSKQSRDPTTSLRDHVQAVLREDFQPSIESVIPLRAQGTVEIPKDKLIQWIRSQA